jgi:hypothetical protein
MPPYAGGGTGTHGGAITMILTIRMLMPVEADL